MEEASIRDRNQQWYLVKQIDAGSESAKVVAQLDLDAWKAEMLIGYTNGSATLAATISGVTPSGWSLIDNTGITIKRTIEGDFTPLEIVEQCRDTYGVYFRFDNVAQTITAVVPDAAHPMGAFATRDLNLKEINYKGKSTTFATRLYAYGADGLTFASINGGKPYVDDNTYSSKVICAVWRDERYTIAENLLADAKKNLAAMAKPSRSYDCDVVDLAATNPDLYAIQDFTIFRVATLIDDAKGFAINYQVVERWNYPYYPEKNKVIFSSSPAKIQNQVQHITDQVENPNSQFNQQQAAAIGNATNWITNGKGYMVAVKDQQGNWMEICSLDTPDIATAKNVWRWNNGGFGFSGTGYNGPYTTAITQDGKIVADFIKAGTLSANIMKAGVLTDVEGKHFSLDLVTGDVWMDVLNLKVGGKPVATEDELDAYTKTNEVRSKFAADSSSVIIDSGVITFNSNSLVVNSTNFKLDSGGNVEIVGNFASENGDYRLQLWGGQYLMSHAGVTSVSMYTSANPEAPGIIQAWDKNGRVSQVSPGEIKSGGTISAAGNATVGGQLVVNGKINPSGQTKVQDLVASGNISASGSVTAPGGLYTNGGNINMNGGHIQMNRGFIDMQWGNIHQATSIRLNSIYDCMNSNGSGNGQCRWVKVMINSIEYCVLTSS